MSPPSSALYRIAAAARITGVSEHTLRVWDRRYGALASRRSDAGYRLYTSDDLGRVRLLKDLVDAGHAIGDIARLPTAELEATRGARRSEPLSPQIVNGARRRFLTAISRFDTTEAARVIATARVALAPYDLVTKLVAPLLTELGDRWVAEGASFVAQEHAALVVLRDGLSALLRDARPHDDGATIIAATPPDEMHECGALIAAVIAAYEGARVVYLGPNLPAASLVNAVKKVGASTVLLSFVCLAGAAANDFLAELGELLDPGTRLLVGGAGVRRTPPAPAVWVRSLSDLRRAIAPSRRR